MEEDKPFWAQYAAEKEAEILRLKRANAQMRALFHEVLDLLEHNPLGTIHDQERYRQWRLVEFALIDKIKKVED